MIGGKISCVSSDQKQTQVLSCCPHNGIRQTDVPLLSDSDGGARDIEIYGNYSKTREKILECGLHAGC